MKISPNPVSDLLKINYQSADYEGVSEVRVFSSNGQMIIDLKKGTAIGMNEYLIETSQLIAGTYYVFIRNSKGTVQDVFVKI